MSLAVSPTSLAAAIDQSIGLTCRPWLLAPKLNLTPSSLAILMNGMLGSLTLESISTAVLVFLHVRTTRRMRSSVHICSSWGWNLRVTHMGCALPMPGITAGGPLFVVLVAWGGAGIF